MRVECGRGGAWAPARMLAAVSLILVTQAVRVSPAAAATSGKLPADEAAWIEFEAGLERFQAGDDREAQEQWRHLVARFPREAEGFGTSTRALLADLERRMKLRGGAAPATEPPGDFGGWSVERRVGWLVEQLDEIAVPQDGSPGGVPLWQDWRVQALIAEGEAAVPALIDAVERDGRFTRSFHYWRDFVHDRTVLTVREPALVAIEAILGVQVYAAGSTGDDFTSGGAEAGRRAAAELRAHFERWRGVPFEERMMKILTDAASPAALARQAADNLAHLGERTVPGTTVWSDARHATDAEAKRRAVARFERPTIAEAMVAAMDRELAGPQATIGQQPGESWRDEVVRSWCRLLADLGDPRIAPELARRVANEPSERGLVALVDASSRLGDASALDAWAARVGAGDVAMPDADSWGFGTLDQVLTILVERPTAATLAARNRLAESSHPWAAPLRQALMKLPAEGPTTGLHDDPWLLMRLLRPSLDDTHPSGVRYAIEDGNRLVMQGAWSQSGGVPSLLADPTTRRERVETEIRDEAAYRLAAWLPGMPPFHPLLRDAEQRREAIRAEIDRRLAAGPPPAPAGR